MTKKDYLALAVILGKYYRKLRDEQEVTHFIMYLQDLTDHLRVDNPRFDGDKFINKIIGE